MIHDIIVYGVAVVIILVAVIYFIFYMRHNKGKELADEFINKLSDQMISIAMSIIKDFDPAQYENIEEFEAACLSTIYAKMWEFVSAEAQASLDDGDLLKLAFKYIDSDAMIKVIDVIFTDANIFNKVENRYAEYNLENKQEVNEEVYSEKEYFENEESNPENIEASDTEYIVNAQAVTNALMNDPDADVENIKAPELNPPREDEEEAFDAEDDSMELIPDENDQFPKIILQQDKNGNDIYFEVYADGKKKRVKKDYALSVLNK